MRFSLGFLFLLFLTPLQATTPLVDVNWLLANLNNPNLVVLDLQPKTTYERFHIPWAISSDYGEWRKPDVKNTPEMIPSDSALERLIEDLVAGNTGDTEFSAQRRHFLAFQKTGNESESFIHRFTLIPRHLGSPQMLNCVNHVFGIFCKLSISKLIKGLRRYFEVSLFRY